MIKGAYATIPAADEETGQDDSGAGNGSSEGSDENGDEESGSDSGGSSENDSGNEGTSVFQSWKYENVEYGYVFNAAYYLSKYADLKKAFGTDEQKAFRHFIKHGMKEGRQASADFNVYVYKDRYADLKKAYGDNLEKYYIHYCKHGYQEKRIAK